MINKLVFIPIFGFFFAFFSGSIIFLNDNYLLYQRNCFILAILLIIGKTFF